MGKLILEDLDYYAYHGCQPFEPEVGNNFVVSIELDLDTEKIENSDNLEDGLDYSKAYEIVSEEMKVRSLMIEHVARRILNALKSKFPEIINCKVKLTKKNPPINGKIGSVSILIEG